MNEYIVLWREVVESKEPFTRTHVRIVEAPSELEAWEDVILDDHLQEQNILSGTVKRVDFLLTPYDDMGLSLVS